MLVDNRVHQGPIAALQLETDLILPAGKVLLKVDRLEGLEGSCSREGVASHRVNLLVANPSEIPAFTKTIGFLALPVHARGNTLRRWDGLSWKVKNGKYQ